MNDFFLHVYLNFFFKFTYLEREREGVSTHARVSTHVGEGHRGETESQAGSTPSTQSTRWGLNSQTEIMS